MEPVPVFDHPLLVDRYPLEWERLKSTVRRMYETMQFHEIDVDHKIDDSCCAKESWDDTRYLVIKEMMAELYPTGSNERPDQEITAQQ